MNEKENITLYLKYRPQRIDELDLEKVRFELKKIVASGKFPHAILLSGPKGTGKTSTARILAKAVNCLNPPPNGGGEPCNACEQCISIMKGNNLDVIELDAASHRGVDDVRAIRDGVKLAATKAIKKVYIIDEAHMLTTEAANALLKTLEEPPNHVMFILATTNAEKLPETVVSRTTNIKFEQASTEEIKRQLTRVTKGEKIDVEGGVLEAIAKASEGSFRDAVKILEQLTLYTPSLKKKEVEEYLWQRDLLRVDDLLKLLVQKDVKKAISEVERIVLKGGSIKNYIDLTIERLRDGLLAEVGFSKNALLGLSKNDILTLISLFFEAKRELGQTVIGQLPLEIAIIKWCEAKPKKENILLDKEKAANTNPSEQARLREQVGVKSLQITPEIWKKILSEVKPKNTSIEALLRAAKPINYDGKTLTLGVYYKFHKEKLETDNYKKILEEVSSLVIGEPVHIVCTLVEQQKTPLTETKDEDIIAAAQDIFGS